MSSVYQHREAFCLMWYACPCGHKERIWNSRDGVTPFGTNCPSCGGSGTLRHTDWHLDYRVPEHKPHRGQRIWRDGRQEEAEAIAERRLEYQRAISSTTLQEIVDNFPLGWPKLDITP